MSLTTKQQYYQDNKEARIAWGKAYYQVDKAARLEYAGRRTPKDYLKSSKIRRERMRLAAQDPILTCSLARFVVSVIKSQKDILKSVTGDTYHLDHIIPLCKGGTDAPWNLRVVTALENLSRPKSGYVN